MSPISIPTRFRIADPCCCSTKSSSCSDDTIVCRKTFREDEFFLQGISPVSRWCRA